MWDFVKEKESFIFINKIMILRKYLFLIKIIKKEMLWVRF